MQEVSCKQYLASVIEIDRLTCLIITTHNIGSPHTNNSTMDISLLLNPQAKHRRMHRGDSMYDEQSIIELETIRCQHCDRGFSPKSYVKHCNAGKSRCLNTKKRAVYDSAKKRILNNQHLSKGEKQRVLKMLKKRNTKTRFSLRRKSKVVKNRSWRDESSELRAAVWLFRVSKRAKLAQREAKKARLTHSQAKESIYNLF